MKFELYKMNFQSAVHFGNGKLSDSEYTFSAARLFSALCIEALHMDGERGITKLVELCNSDRLRLSDAFPYSADTYYVPKPLIYIEHEEGKDSSIIKKQAKKLKYVDVSKIDLWLNGNLDFQEEYSKLKNIGVKDVREMSAVKELDSAVPYPVGTFRFNDDWGLYFIVGYSDEEVLNLVLDLLFSLECSGIGGKRTAGLGQFKLVFVKNFPKEARNRLTVKNSAETGQFLLLSSAMDDDLEEVMHNASYSIGKISGYVASESYSQTALKKREYYYFKSGSVFSRTFNGKIAEVSNHGGHPVYEYSMPIFLEV